MIKQEPIDNGTVRLRAYREDDADDVAAACDDPLTHRFLPDLPDPYTRADAVGWIREGAPAAWTASGAAYAVVDVASDRLLGGVGLGRVEPDRGKGEIGYWTAPWARGRGVASSAATALADAAFAAGLSRVELLAEMENPASLRVALRAGFGYEGLRRGAAAARGGARRDLLAFARLSTDAAGPIPRTLPDLPGGALTDGVVTLRPMAPTDAEFLYTLLNLPDVVATMVPPVAPDRIEAELRCARAESRWLIGERADLVICDATTGAPAGDIGLYYQEQGTQQAMIGYSLLPTFRRRGFTTRAAVLVARWAFAETGIKRLIAGTNPDNVGSQRVLERAGFTREGYQRSRLPGVTTRIDDILFAILPSDLATP